MNEFTVLRPFALREIVSEVVATIQAKVAVIRRRLVVSKIRSIVERRRALRLAFVARVNVLVLEF